MERTTQMMIEVIVAIGAVAIIIAFVVRQLGSMT